MAGSAASTASVSCSWNAPETRKGATAGSQQQAGPVAPQLGGEGVEPHFTGVQHVAHPVGGMGIGGRGVGWALIVQAQLGARRQRQIPSRARRHAQRALLHADAAKPVFLSHAVAAGARLDVAVTRAHHEGPRLRARLVTHMQRYLAGAQPQAAARRR